MPHRYALFFATNRRFFFALAVLLMSLKEKSPRLLENADILVYHQELLAKDQALLNKILPCQFVNYQFPIETDFNNINFKNFTQLAFARYDIFDLLDHYEKILYMDVDMLVNGELLPIVDNYANQSGLAMCQDMQKGKSLITKNFVHPLDTYDMSVPCYNSGFTLFGRAICHRHELRMWCYQKTDEWLENLVCPDQGVLNILAQEFNFQIEKLPDTCNCLPSNAKYLDKKCHEVLVYHCAGGGLRFWTYTWFAPWQKYYREYLALGGETHTDKEHAWLKFIKRWHLQKYAFFDRSPDPQMHPNRFLKYMLTYPFKYWLTK